MPLSLLLWISIGSSPCWDHHGNSPRFESSLQQHKQGLLKLHISITPWIRSKMTWPILFCLGTVSSQPGSSAPQWPHTYRGYFLPDLFIPLSEQLQVQQTKTFHSLFFRIQLLITQDDQFIPELNKYPERPLEMFVTNAAPQESISISDHISGFKQRSKTVFFLKNQHQVRHASVE